MMKMEPGVTTYFEWIASNMKAGEVIGVDPSQISAAGYKLRSKYFEEKSLTLKTLSENLVDIVWGS